jgi:hypothetical protein
MSRVSLSVSSNFHVVASQEASRRARALATTYRDKHGKKRVTGLKKELKESQYAPYVCRKVAS